MHTDIAERSQQVEDILHNPSLLSDVLKAAQGNAELHGAITAPTRQRRRQTAASTRSKPMSDTSVATATQPSPAAKPNTLSLADLLVTAEDLGKQAALGVDVQIKMDLKVLDAAFQGVVDLSANKHGTGIDDATKLSEAYWKSRNGAAVFDAKAANQRKLISNIRKSVKLGMWSKGGPGEPLNTVNNLMTLRQKLRRDPATAKKLDDAHNTFMRFATQQLKRDQVIPDAELAAFCYRPERDEATLEDFYEGTRKKFQKLRDGKLSGMQDTGKEIDDVIRACTSKLVAIAKAKGTQSGMATPSKGSKTTP